MRRAQDADAKPLDGIGDIKFFEFGKVKIGVVGLTSDDSPVKSSPGDLKFLPTVETAIGRMDMEY